MAGGRFLTPEQQFAGERGLVAAGSQNHLFWVLAAAEVGIDAREISVDTGQVYDERRRMVDVLGMAPPCDKVWTWEHARAAKFITALRSNADMTNLTVTELELLNGAVRATWTHVEGVVPNEEVAALTDLVPRIESYVESMAEFARMDRELLDLS